MPLSLYLHYPFCVRKCLYCDFLSGPGSVDAQTRYLAALQQEVACSGMEGAPVDTIFFGGGTPSLMPVPALSDLLDGIRAHFCVDPDAEITLECNPGTVDVEKLLGFQEAGVNRLSIGVQSFHEDELRLLGRIHTAEEAVDCFRAARRAGFENISLDLMSALPGQDYAAWMDNLEQAVRLGPEHISAYGLILEEGTPLLRSYEAGQLPPVAEDEEDRRMYHDTKSFLEQAGYHRYEISNYAREGRACRHNLGYWSGHDYLGLGLGASSLIGSWRFRNERELGTYEMLCHGEEAAPCSDGLLHAGSAAEGAPPFRSRRLRGLTQETEYLSVRDRMGEFMWLGLRKSAGVSRAEFGHRFGVSLQSVFGDVIDEHKCRGLLEEEDGRIRLTEYGTDISNFVMADFV